VQIDEPKFQSSIASETPLTSNMAQDVMRGMRENALRGYFSDGSSPFGYMVTKVKDGVRLRSKLVPEPSAALVVKRMFDQYISGKGLKEIAKCLNKDGILTRGGRRWGSTVIHHILTNETYKGTLVWSKLTSNNLIRVDNAWLGIIESNLFNSVQLRLKERGSKLAHLRRVASEYLLSGLLRCGVCGKAMSGHSAKSGKFFYYRCTNATKRGPEECPGRWLPRQKLDRFVVDKIRNSILSEDNLTKLANITREEMNSDTRAQRDQLEILDGQISDTEVRLEHLFDALEKGSFSQEELGPRIRKLQSRKNELESAKQQLNYSIQSKLDEAPDVEKVQEFVADMKSLLISSPIVEQKTFLKVFIRNIVVGSNEMTIHYTLPIGPTGATEDVTGVLPFIRHGEPSGIRTQDHLIKSCT
jgi:site-specific DNA recombinase